MRSIRLIPLTLPALVLLAACDSTGPGGDELALNLAVASVSGEAAAQHVETMRGPGGPLGFGFEARPGRFECDGREREGITVTRTCTYRDAQGNVQAAYDSLTTASVRMQLEISVTMDRGHMSATMSRSSDLTVTGLAGQETSMTWNGTSSGNTTRVRTSDTGALEMAMREEEAITNVVVPVPRTPASWPISGTITRTVTVTFLGGPKDGTTETREVTITFNGTQTATITVNGETFDFDLSIRGRPQGRGRHGPPGARP